MSKNLEQRVATLEKLVKELTKNKSFKVTGKHEIGDTFDILGLKWKILDITEKGYVCIADRLEDAMQFDSACNNWQSSDLRNYLNTEFFNMLAAEIGAENIIEFERDLLSLDGQTEYGICCDKISLLNVDEYRKYRKLILNTEDYWWWLITPDSTKCNDDTRWVRVVSPSGDVRNSIYYGRNGVRPVCIFSSAIFESEE